MQELTIFFNQHLVLCLSTIVVLILVILLEWTKAKRNISNLSPVAVTQLINRNQAAVIDVRTKDAFQSGHIVNAHHIQSQDVLANGKKLEKFRPNPIIIVAQSSQEGQKIAAFLLKNGYNAFSLAGGISAWQEAQMPLIKE